VLFAAALQRSAHSFCQATILKRVPAAACVARFLLDFFKQKAASKLLDLPMSRADVADYLGLTVELFCRILSCFADERVIRVPNVRHIEIVDMPALETIALGE
jgi:CRP/FNR family transcriptional regulator, nitrogen fixation regulation protein